MRRLAAMAALLVACAYADARAGDAADKEVAVRAAFLFRLAFFVSWPTDSFASEASPIRLCLREPAPAPLARILREQTATRSVQERPVEIAAIADDDRADGCHLLYVASGQTAPDAPPPWALVVVDTLPALERQGALALVREQIASETRLVFYADRARLQGAQYTVSAQLLQLVRFHPRREPAG